jgi:hypothetical protein
MPPWRRGKKMKWSAWDALRAGKLNLPPGYYVELDADSMALHRPDGSVVAVFSARGVAPAEVVRTAEEDYRKNGESSA